jgi:hypothetical protein
VPELELRVPDRDGRPVDPAAFAFPAARVLGEFVDRLQDRVEPDEREATLRDAGWRVVRWSWPQLRAPEPWAQRLRSALAGVPREVW